MSAARFYTMRSCNDDYVPVARQQNKLETKIVFNWLDLDETDARFVPDAKLEALDAKLEALYNTDVIMMELTLSEPEDYVRPDFDYEGELEEYLIYDDSGEMTPRGRIITNYDSAIVEDDQDDPDYDDDHYEEFSRSDRFCDRIITNYDSNLVEDDDHYEEFSRCYLFCDDDDYCCECKECGEKFSNFLNSDVCENCYETLINIE